MRYVLIAGLSAILTVTGSHFLVAADQRNVPEVGLQDGSPSSLYTPPKKLIPRARIGGTLRGLEGAQPEIVALVPDHVGWTAKQAPTLNWFLSKPTTAQLVFTLNDDRKILPIYEAHLTAPSAAGVQSIDLKSLGLNLEPNVQYRWFVSAVAETPSRDIVAGGMIERCELSECMIERSLILTCDHDSVRLNALNGFWYDAMGCLCNLIDKSPKDHSLRRLRAALLRQVGLNVVADWDLKAIQSSAQ